MIKKPAHVACLLAALILPLPATCDGPFVFENPADLDNPDYIHLEGITLDRETIRLVAGGSTSLTPTLNPAKAHDKRIEWTTSNAAVATVDSAGLVSAIALGQAVIEALSISNNEIRASCTVTVVDATSKEITGFGFVGLASDIPVVIDHDNGTITVSLPSGTNLENLVATFTSSGAQVRIGDIIQVSGTTANDFSNPVIYTVVADDGSTRTYTLTIQLTTLTSKEITGFGFTIGGSHFNGTINNTAGTILVTVPFATNRNGLVPVITHVGKSINPLSGIARDFTTPKSYRVLALDDSYRDYAVTVNIADAVITFDADGGTPSTQTCMVEHPATTTGSLPASPTRTGYTFSSWRTGRNGTGTTFDGSTTITGTTTVFAHWIPVSYSITNTLNGGTNHGANPASYTIESATISLQAPSRTGYDFLGWYDNAAFSGSPITQLETGSIGVRTYYARWAAKFYTVTFDMRGGTDGSSTVIATYDQEMPAATAPSRTGYTFGGYYTAIGGEGTQYYNAEMASLRSWDITNNTTLYAKWAVPDLSSPNIGLLKGIPAGRFQRDGTAANISVITQPYRISRYEISRAQFLAIMGTDPSSTTNSSGTSDPVQRVNWYHAIAFCNKLSIAEGLTPVYAVTGVNFSTLTYAGIPTTSNADWNAATATWTNNGYRLPTEMEWMWAAMGAPEDGQGGGINTTGYLKGYAGSTEGAGQTNIGNYAWYGVNGSNKSHPAGTKTANGLGLFDMSGNVWEWVWDWSGSYPTGTATDYRGAALGTDRVPRGGGWESNASYCTIAYRGNGYPYSQLFCIGFRVVRP